MRLGAKYLMVAGVVTAFVAILLAVLNMSSAGNRGAATLIQPIVALVALTGVVWLLMVVYRNVAIIRGQASERYYQTYTTQAPAEWIERPTRAYMNLLEVPVLFYVVCLLMLATGKFDAAHVSLAWLFVATRYVHAFIYIGFNYVPLRFAAFVTGVVTLAVMWTRFAMVNL